ncbi:MAG TPA: hypothetical protein DCM05_17990 [Elusimicrobia bacterium]|nr:hypothetical protein [Elusimicrobiota bacterium]
MRILVVDDSEPVREMLRMVLRSLGHEVVAAAGTGEEALAAYAQAHPDLVTLDISLPDISGVEVLRRLRALDPKARVIVITGNNSAVLAEQVRSLGALHLIEKPCGPAELMKALALVEGEPPA